MEVLERDILVNWEITYSPPLRDLGEVIGVNCPRPGDDERLLPRPLVLLLFELLDDDLLVLLDELVFEDRELDRPLLRLVFPSFELLLLFLFADLEERPLLDCELRDLDRSGAGSAGSGGCLYWHSNILHFVPYLQSGGCQYLQSVLVHTFLRYALHGGLSFSPFGAVPVRRILDPFGDRDVLSLENRRPFLSRDGVLSLLCGLRVLRWELWLLFEPFELARLSCECRR